MDNNECKNNFTVLPIMSGVHVGMGYLNIMNDKLSKILGNKA